MPFLILLKNSANGAFPGASRLGSYSSCPTASVSHDAVTTTRNTTIKRYIFAFTPVKRPKHSVWSEKSSTTDLKGFISRSRVGPFYSSAPSYFIHSYEFFSSGQHGQLSPISVRQG